VGHLLPGIPAEDAARHRSIRRATAALPGVAVCMEHHPDEYEKGRSDHDGNQNDSQY
jgi:hypothetical protein